MNTKITEIDLPKSFVLSSTVNSFFFSALSMYTILASNIILFQLFTVAGFYNTLSASV